VTYRNVESPSSCLKTLLPQINPVAFACQGASRLKLQPADVGTSIPLGLYTLVYWPRRQRAFVEDTWPCARGRKGFGVVVERIRRYFVEEHSSMTQSWLCRLSKTELEVRSGHQHTGVESRPPSIHTLCASTTELKDFNPDSLL